MAQQKTLQEIINDYMTAAGLTVSDAVTVKFPNGQIISIHSDGDERLNEFFDPTGVTVTPRNKTAKAGR